MPKVVRSRKGVPKGQLLRPFKVGVGLPALPELEDEVDKMKDILMGREESPVTGVLALMEVADAFFARTAEMEMMILRLEREGRVTRSHPLYRFRTQELRAFKELCSRAADLGSRRMTAENLRTERERLGRESHGG